MPEAKNPTEIAYRVNLADGGVIEHITERRDTGALPDDQVWIFQNELVEGQVPQIGWIWDRQRPASFTAPAVSPDAPMNITEARERRDAAMSELAQANAAYDALLD